MPTTATRTSQLNLRVDPQVRQDAEAALGLAHTSVGDLVRAALAKAARSPEDCAELLRSVRTEADGPDVAEALRESWSAADDFCRSVGLGVASDPHAEQSWDELYDEAMAEHFAEKGLVR